MRPKIRTPILHEGKFIVLEIHQKSKVHVLPVALSKIALSNLQVSNRRFTEFMPSSCNFRNMIRVLFVCVHNSARSQMAEAFCNKYGKGQFLAESAGLEPGILNPYVVRAMAEVGIDISKNQTKSVFDFFKEGRFYNAVVTVCSKDAAERCPIFPGALVTLHWPFDDPARFKGSDEEIMVKVRQVRDAIEQKVKEFMDTWPEVETAPTQMSPSSRTPDSRP